MKIKTKKSLITRSVFVLLSAAIVVFFSEKTFWYIQGYAILELVLFYSLPVAVCLGTLDYFRVQRLSGIVLVGALFGFLVEGVLTPVAYEAGLFDPVMPAYFVGWHGLISLVFGWYFIRKCLVNSHWIRLTLLSSAFGIFWGAWSLPYRLSESIQEFEALVQAGEYFRPGAWPVEEYLVYTLVFTGMMMAAHWLLGKGLWQQEFKLKRWELGLLLALLLFIFAFQVFPIVPLGILKLIFLIAVVLLPLRINRLQREEEGVLVRLDGKLRFLQTLPLLAMPAAATFVYGMAVLLPPSEEVLRFIYTSFSSSQGLIGAGFFIWAWVDSVRKPA
jgi:hypothetical protein